MPDINLDHFNSLPPGQRDYWRYMAAPRGRVRTLAALAAEFAPANLLDLGCGDGALLRALGQRLPGAKLAGVDFAPAQIEVNRRAAPGLEWHVADLQKEEPALPERAGRFDAVFASEIIEHLEFPDRLLRQAFRLAAPGGRLFLSTQSGRVGETERRVGHRRHFTAEEMGGFLRAAGWRPLRIWNAGWPFHDLSKRLANLAPGAALREFGDKPYGFLQWTVCAVLRGLFLFNSRRRGAQLYALAQKD